MNSDLYFIPIIARALKEPDPQAALKAAFDEIKCLGQQKQFSRGLAQFEMFMDSVRTAHNLQETDHARRLMAELATETFAGNPSQRQAILDGIRSRPEWQAEFEAISNEIAEESGQFTVPLIRVLRENQLISEMIFHEVPARRSAIDIVPGHYQLRFVTGRVLWEGELTAKDLIWTEAFPDQGLDLAAETEEAKGRPTRQIELWEGEVILRIYAGVESGSIEVELTT